MPFGLLPAEKARNLPRPSRLRMDSAMIERAEFPVQRKRHVEDLSVGSFGHGYFLRWLLLGAGVQQASSRGVSPRPQTSGCPSQQSLIKKPISARIPSMSAR